MSLSRTKLPMLLALLAGAFVVLYVTDRAMRRLAQMDQAVIQGQTGFTVVDEFLSKRAADQAALRKLSTAIAKASNLDQLVRANYELTRYEAKQSRPDSKRTRASLRAITSAAGPHPEAAEAWRDLIGFAEKDQEPAVKIVPLVNAYAITVRNTVKLKERLNRLLDLRQLAVKYRLRELEVETLVLIHRGFPRSVQAFRAYEELAQHYRETGRTNELAAVEGSIRETRQLIRDR